MIGLDEFHQFVQSRRSVRRFKDTPVPRELLEKLLEAASWAPSASNRQDWLFCVITDPEKKDRMAAAVRESWARLAADTELGAVAEGMQDYSKNFDWFSQAPVVIVVAAKRPESFLTAMFDTGVERIAGAATSAALATENLMLAAHAAGLGTCCLTGPLGAATELKDILELGNRRDLVCVIAMGYPDEEPSAPLRKGVDKITRYYK